MSENELLQEALKEKLYSAEKRISMLRMLLVLFNTFIYLFCYTPDEMAWLAYTVIVVANIYGLTSLVFEPYRKITFLSSIYYTTITDSLLIVSWIIATGLMESPFYVIWYISLMAVAFRYSLKETAITTAVYLSLYLMLFFFDGDSYISVEELLTRVGYIPLVGILSMYFSIEISDQIDGKLKIVKGEQALKQAHGELERKVELRTEELSIINKDLTDSINYAERIQMAILPSNSEFEAAFQESFVFHLPKDIISGDFHWMYSNEDVTYVAVVDCTGHGVPGALLSMVGNNLLNNTVIDKGILNPGDVLSRMDEALGDTLNAVIDGVPVNDGMDMSVCMIDHTKRKLKFSGAQAHGILISNGSITMLEPTKYSIGGLLIEKNKSFETFELDFNQGDSLYLFTDGFQDQFGGRKGKKFYRKNLLKLIESVHDRPMEEQLATLKKTFETWKGSLAQVDDVTVMGLRL